MVWPNLEALKSLKSMMATYHRPLDDALRKHGIELNLPQSGLHLCSCLGRGVRDAISAMDNSGAQPLSGCKLCAKSSPSTNGVGDGINLGNADD